MPAHPANPSVLARTRTSDDSPWDRTRQDNISWFIRRAADPPLARGVGSAPKAVHYVSTDRSSLFARYRGISAKKGEGERKRDRQREKGGEKEREEEREKKSYIYEQKEKKKIFERDATESPIPPPSLPSVRENPPCAKLVNPGGRGAFVNSFRRGRGAAPAPL